MDQLQYEGKGIFVRDGPFVEISIVLHQSEFPVFLFNEEESTGIGGFRSSDALKPEILVQEFVLLLLFSWRQRVDSTVDRGWGIRF